jgi:hypothetical protein
MPVFVSPVKLKAGADALPTGTPLIPGELIEERPVIEPVPLMLTAICQYLKRLPSFGRHQQLLQHRHQW